MVDTAGVNDPIKPIDLTFSDGRAISPLSEIHSAKPIGNAPVEFTANVSEAGAHVLSEKPAAFYRGTDGEARYTITVDSVTVTTIAGTIRRR
jgi:hypothetical protein